MQCCENEQFIGKMPSFFASHCMLIKFGMGQTFSVSPSAWKVFSRATADPVQQLKNFQKLLLGQRILYIAYSTNPKYFTRNSANSQLVCHIKPRIIQFSPNPFEAKFAFELKLLFQCYNFLFNCFYSPFCWKNYASMTLLF